MAVHPPKALSAYLPPGLPAERVAASVGLISDTHMPERCAALPGALFHVLDGVDLLLHAGDIGELRVLDRLSAIAPVIAVHGNDETAEAQRELPYQQLIGIGSARILLTHSHFPDRDEEMAFRRFDSWEPKRARWAAMGKRAGARIVVFGHTHIPMADHHEGVLLINPGAIASAGWVLRQRIQSVALLFLRNDGAPFVSHVDLASPGRAYTPEIDWEAGFAAAHRQFSESLLAPDLEAVWIEVMTEGRQNLDSFRAALLRIAHRCWAGEQPSIGREDLLEAVRSEPGFDTRVRASLEAVLRAGSKDP